MPTARLTLADAPALKAMHDAAVPDIVWPGGAAPFSLEAWQMVLIPMGGWKVTAANGTLRGFLITPARPVPVGPDAGAEAEECLLWIAPTSLSNAVFASSTKELFTAWWGDLNTRGVPRGWGKNPPQHRQRTENWFQNAITRGGMTVFTRTEDGVEWRYVVMSPARALAGLNNL